MFPQTEPLKDFTRNSECYLVTSKRYIATLNELLGTWLLESVEEIEDLGYLRFLKNLITSDFLKKLNNLVNI